MNRPTTSFKVVINGPVATAGSILYLFSTSGIKVPKIAAKTITINNAILTEIPRVMVSSNQVTTKMTELQISPFKSPKPASR